MTALLTEALAVVFANGSRKAWVEELTGAGVSAIENLSIPDYHDDPHIREAGLIVSRDHPGMGMADHLGRGAAIVGDSCESGSAHAGAGRRDQRNPGGGGIQRRRNCRFKGSRRRGSKRGINRRPASFRCSLPLQGNAGTERLSPELQASDAGDLALALRGSGNDEKPH